MTSGELSFESPALLRITWTVPDFFRLATGSDHSLLSPDFTFADGRHRLRLFQTRDLGFEDIRIELLNSNDPDPGRAVLNEVVLPSTDEEIELYRRKDNKSVFCIRRSDLEEDRDLYVPDDTLTVLCSVRSIQPGSAGSPESGGAQPPVFPQYRMTGNLSSESFPCLYVTWRIPAFFKATWESRCEVVSPEFSFSDRRYCLRLFSSRPCFVHMRLVNLTDKVPERYVSYEVGLKSTTGEEIHLWDRGTPTRRAFFIFRSDLDGMEGVHFRDGHLTVFCCMRSKELSSGGSPKCVGAETESSKALVGQAAAHPKSSGAETSNEEDDKEALPGGVANVLSDYKRLLLSGAESDACLVVCGKEFQVHRNVLRARSPVFEAMFDHKTAEKASGRVVIDDLKPDRFHDFLEYLYTGRVESFCDDNAFGLYAAADKYDVPTLKSECVEYMRRSLSVDNFCDVITLALRHHEQDLLEQAVEFFKKNVAGIILTVKWQQFMSENSTRANELFIKLHAPGKESENVLLP